VLAIFGAPRSALAEYVHEGFLFHGGLGMSYNNISETAEGGGVSFDDTVTGLGARMNVLFGGTPAPGLVVGGGFGGTSIIDPTVEFQGMEFESTDTSVTLVNFVGFLQYYPDPAKGLFVRGSLGYGTGSVEVEGRTTAEDIDGPVFGGALGHTWWMAPEWSIGLEGEFLVAALSKDEDGVSSSSTWLSPALSLVFTYH
jgi:hypothetical protein